MNTIFVIAFATLLWFCSLLQGTGIGNSIDITGKVHFFLVGISILLALRKHSSWKMTNRMFRILAGLILVFVAVPYFTNNQTGGIDYLLVFLVVFILSEFSITESCIKWIAWIYGFLGILFLVVYNQTSILAGWNKNSIAMIGFFSCSVWILGVMTFSEKKGKIISVITAGVYLALLEITEARSSTLFVIVGLLLVLNVIKLQALWYKRGYKFLLYIPFIVAVLCIIISKLPFFPYLDLWSYREFQKPLFNGRELIWTDGIEKLFMNPVFGVGKIENGWHNSAVTCLAAYGIIGYILWINLFSYITEKGQDFIQDKYIYGSLIAFFLIYLQQSVELGLIATNPNFIPYVALGILLGRVKYLNRQENKTYENNYANI